MNLVWTDLEPWLAQDPILRAFVNTRLRQRLHKAKVSLKLSQAMSLSSELTGVLKGQGINVGGNYKQVFEGPGAVHHEPVASTGTPSWKWGRSRLAADAG
jgi:hypothetical protein